MADYTLADNAIGVHNIALAPNTEVIVDMPPAGTVEVASLASTAPVYFSVNGKPATVGGTDCYLLFPGVNAATVRLPSAFMSLSARSAVRLISAAAATVSVSRG